MKITPDIEAQQCRYDGRWFPLVRALDVDVASGVAHVASASGAPVEVVGVFRVIDLATGEVLDTAAPKWAPAVEHQVGEPAVPVEPDAQQHDPEP